MYCDGFMICPECGFPVEAKTEEENIEMPLPPRPSQEYKFAMHPLGFKQTPQPAPQAQPVAPQPAPQGYPQPAPQPAPQGYPQPAPQPAPQGYPQGYPQPAPQNNYPYQYKKMKVPGSWSVGRLVIGIIGIVACVYVGFIGLIISWAMSMADIFNVYVKSSSQGALGLICSAGLLIGGIANIAGRNSDKKTSNIVALIAHVLGAACVLIPSGIYPGITICGALSLAFAVINLGSLLAMIEGGRKSSRQTLILVLSVILSLILFLASYGIAYSRRQSGRYMGTTYNVEETVEFKGLEIVVHDDITVDRSTEEKGGIIRVPVTITNTSDEPNRLGRYEYYTYDPDGELVLSSFQGYFRRDSIEYADELQPGESYKKYIYCGYTGDGEYTLLLTDKKEIASVKFTVEKK